MEWAPCVDYYWASRYQGLDQLVGRSLAFVPLGVLIAVWSGAGPRSRRGLMTAALTGLAVDLIIETGQFFIPERHPSTTDLLIQTLGACLGYAAARHVARALAADDPPTD
jgi:VanZ family protein